MKRLVRARATLAAAVLVAGVAGVAAVVRNDGTATLVPVAGPAQTTTPPAQPQTPPASPVDPGMPEEVLAEYRRAHPNVPVDVLYARLALMTPRSKLLRQWGKLHKQTFGGSWYDFDNGVWHLLSTDAALLEVMAAQARAEGVEVAPRVVPYSLEQLYQRALLIQSGKDPISEISTKAGVEIMANKVKVVVSPPPQDVHDPMVMFVESE